MRHADITITSGYGDMPGAGHDVTLLSRIASVARGWMDRYSQRHTLSLLDDRLLKDIGVTRLDAAQEIEKPFWQS